MSGPSLKKLDAHRSIHDAAFFEAKELTELLVHLHSEGRKEQSLDVADTLVESWEHRTIAHADSEEEGFYKELEKNPDLEAIIMKLRRDHEILRTIVANVKGLLSERKISEEIIQNLQALLVVVQIHSREEEKHLLFDHETH